MIAGTCKVEDAGLIAALHSKCFRPAWSRHSFQQLLGSQSTIGLTAGEPAAGFIIIRVAGDEAEVLTLGVVPEHRRSGLGRSLVLGAAEFAFSSGVRELFLEVDVTNGPANALYQRLGFREVGRRSAYYRTCDSVADALVLRRALPIPAWEST